MKINYSRFNGDKLVKVIFFALLLFSWFLMAKTFRINSKGNLEIASKVWSDFAATIPLIRSFSYGANFPPQYPIFAGPPIRYHFIFFAVVGLLEKVGVPLDLALNSISTFSFFLLILFIYLLAKEVFDKRSIALISVVLFIFNGSFSFLEFFKKHPLSANTLMAIVKNETFPSFGPYDGKVVSAFWSLNIFTNQRHLALAYAAFLALLLLIHKYSKNPKKFTYLKSLAIGLFVGLFPFLHTAVFAMMGIALIIFSVIYPKLRLKLAISGLVALILCLPQILYMGSSQIEFSYFNPGYLVETLTALNFSKYWFLNLGLASILAPAGFFWAKKSQRKIFIPFLSFFVLGNIFQFTPDLPTNHKFFNLFAIGANMFVSFFLIQLWSFKFIGKLLFPILVFSLVLSGIIDFFPILNDVYLELEDIPNNKVATYIAKNAPKGSVFLNSSFLYDPASIAGRKIFLGWPYFSWGAGYDTDKRNKELIELLNPKEKSDLCLALLNNKIDYVEIQNPTNLVDIPIDYQFFENNFTRVYLDSNKNIAIYSVELSCR